MAIVKLGEQRLWVEGQDAYSIDEIKQRHAELLEHKQLLADRIAEEDAEIKAHQEQHDELVREAEEVQNEFEGVDKILERILHAEEAPVVEEVVEVKEELVQPEEVPELKVEEPVELVAGNELILGDEIAKEAEESVEEKVEVPEEVKEDLPAKKSVFKNRVKIIC